MSEFQSKYLCREEDVEQYRQILELDVEEFLFVILREKKDIINRTRQKGWVFPYHVIPKGCRLILYGAGTVGQEYYKQLEKTAYCSKFRLVDQNYIEYQNLGKPIERPEIMKDKDFDYVLAIQNKKIQESVKRWIQSIGIEISKIKCMN